MKKRARLKLLIPVLALIALTAVVSAPVYIQRILNPTTDDYDAHIVWTLKMLKFKLPPIYVVAHPLYQLTVGFIYWAGRGLIGLFETAALVQVLAQIAAALVLYFWIGTIPGIPGRWGPALRVFLSLSLTLVAPVMLLWPVDHQFYFGYIGLASYHNPTVHLLRPLALLEFIFALRIFKSDSGQTPGVHSRSPLWMVLLSAIITLAGMLCKPNYGIAFLPALVVVAVWFLWKKRPLDGRLLIWGQIVPTLVALAFQAVLIYMLPDPENAGIIIAPFQVERIYSAYLPVKLLLSILFPLGVLFLLRRRILADTGLLLALLAFGAALIQLYFFAESGARLPHGNFRWGAQITLFILFAVSVRRLLSLRLDAISLPPLNRPRLWPVYGLYLLHLAAGVAYYIYALIQPNYN
jgi:hypothetical protein